MNMDYCKWENTYRALRQCAESLFEKGEDSADVIAKLSESEKIYQQRTMDLCATLLEEMNYTVEAPNDEEV